MKHRWLRRGYWYFLFLIIVQFYRTFVIISKQLIKNYLSLLCYILGKQSSDLAWYRSRNTNAIDFHTSDHLCWDHSQCKRFVRKFEKHYISRFKIFLPIYTELHNVTKILNRCILECIPDSEEAGLYGSKVCLATIFFIYIFYAYRSGKVS